jgi:DNA invertase Pin-like site-specific DNA recombinase
VVAGAGAQSGGAAEPEKTAPPVVRFKLPLRLYRGYLIVVEGSIGSLQKLNFFGASSNRPALNELLKACRRGSVDVVVVWKFDRFARSLKQLMSGLETCRSLGIDFVSVTEAVDTSLPAGELVFQMIGAVAQFERSLIGERVRSGLANARAKGKSLGRPSLRKLSPAETRQLRQERIRQNVPFRVLARRFGVSVWTAHRLCAGHS